MAQCENFPNCLFAECMIYPNPGHYSGKLDIDWFFLDHSCHLCLLSQRSSRSSELILEVSSGRSV